VAGRPAEKGQACRPAHGRAARSPGSAPDRRWRTCACTRSPARTPAAITVGGSTRGDVRDTTYSNFGSCVTLFAPGTDSRTIGGTSMAAPHAAGVAALYLEQRPTAQPATVKALIVDSATTDVLGDIGAGWTTVPAVLSTGNGTFRLANGGVGDFAGWAQVPGATVVGRRTAW
jgi:subtilisin family serine protease